MTKITNNDPEHSFIVSLSSRFIEWGNKYLTLSQWFFKKSKNIFVDLEIMMVIVTTTCLILLCVIEYLPYWLSIVISILLFQRVLEFFIVYSRNFIFNRGRIFSAFSNSQNRGEWLITMFGFNVFQIIFIFALWYRVISKIDPTAFSHPLSVLNSIYFSFVTFVTVGYGDIYPVSSLAQIVVIFQVALTFFILVIVVNGLISIHFNKN